ncbi:MAG: ABC transporter ATP-binding protein [Clostridia bacterium]|nr:ABC transporter ATP-binding protein [Clostridia bacterium]
MMYGPRMPHKPLTDGIEKPKRLRDYPGYFMKKIKGFTSRLFYIVSLVWESSPWLLIAMALLCLLSGVLPIAGAYITSALLNGVADIIGATSTGDIARDVLETMRPLLFLFLLLLIYQFLNRTVGRVDKMVSGVAGELVVNHIKLKIITKSRDVDLRSFDDPEFYGKLENANREASMRPIGILTATFNVISSLISVVSFIGILAILSPFAPLVVIAAAIPGAAVNYAYRNRNFRYIRFRSRERREMTYYSDLMVNKDLAKEVKILGLGDTLIDKYKTVFARYFKGLRSLLVKEGVTQILVGLLTVVAHCALFGYVAYNVIFSGDGRIGDYSLYTGALTSITTYVTTLVTSTATIYEGTLFIENMIEFMKEERTVVASGEVGKIPARSVPHTIEFVGVSFAYPGKKRKVIDNLNLKINAGESVVLVGLNGAGKTTLIKLLTRLYDPTEGKILLDGVDLREYEPEALYNIFGIVFQDFGKYSVTVEENIRFGDVERECGRDSVEAAARHGNAHDFIMELPENYSTPLTRIFDEEGTELSGGQWQKLSISRAFFKNSEILILDEPTASLDPLAEQEIFSQFYELAKGKITLFVSHRLSSAVSASKIVLLDGGRVAEEGTHEELMEKHGKYYTLFSTQASRYTGEEFDTDSAEFASRFISEHADPRV